MHKIAKMGKKEVFFRFFQKKVEKSGGLWGKVYNFVAKFHFIKMFVCDFWVT